MKNVLILPGWKSKASDNWYPWVANKLQHTGFATHILNHVEMSSDKPDMDKILSDISTQYPVSIETTVIGHSLGCLLAMRLAELYSYEKMVLVAGWDFDDLTDGHALFWKNKINHNKIKHHIKKSYVVHSDNDPYITAITAEDMSKRLNAEFVLIKNAGHFGSTEGLKEFPELLKFV